MRITAACSHPKTAKNSKRGKAWLAQSTSAQQVASAVSRRMHSAEEGQGSVLHPKWQPDGLPSLSNLFLSQVINQVKSGQSTTAGRATLCRAHGQAGRLAAGQAPRVGVPVGHVGWEMMSGQPRCRDSTSVSTR